MPQIKSIVTQDRSSQRIHERFVQVWKGFDAADPHRTSRRTLVDERCQTDQSGEWDLLNVTVREARIVGAPNIDPALLCRYCFPRVSHETA